MSPPVFLKSVIGYMSVWRFDIILLSNSKSVNRSKALFLSSVNAVDGPCPGVLPTSNPKNRFQIKFDDSPSRDDDDDDDDDDEDDDEYCATFGGGIKKCSLFAIKSHFSSSFFRIVSTRLECI